MVTTSIFIHHTMTLYFSSFLSLSISLSLPHSFTICLCLLLSLKSIHFVPQSVAQSDDVDLSGVDVWAADFDPTTVFDKESLDEITEFFVKNAGDINGQIR